MPEASTPVTPLTPLTAPLTSALTAPLTAPVAIREAATVVIQRTGPGGREVLMLRRNPNAVFVAGHFVFPGGAVDAADAALAANPAFVGGLVGTADAVVSAQHGFTLATYVVAAVREAFEEAGVFLARDQNGAPIDFSNTEIRERFSQHRVALNARSTTFNEILREEKLRILCSDLTYWSRWITPIGPPRRFDARFFLAQLPIGHAASPDHGELVHSEWIRPIDALTQFESGQFPIILPTIKTLRSLVDA
jgi:8-oxo-dGTP pyrophosphatase MutT (NUDIX family)